MLLERAQSLLQNQGIGETRPPASDLKARLEITSAPAPKLPLLVSSESPKDPGDMG